MGGPRKTLPTTGSLLVATTGAGARHSGLVQRNGLRTYLTVSATATVDEQCECFGGRKCLSTCTSTGTCVGLRRDVHVVNETRLLTDTLGTLRKSVVGEQVDCTLVTLRLGVCVNARENSRTDHAQQGSRADSEASDTHTAGFLRHHVSDFGLFVVAKIVTMGVFHDFEKFC